jgi:hypothetical protein
MRLRDEDDGNVLIMVILVSMLVGAMVSLTLTTGEQADRASARDRNRDVALGVAESSIHDAVATLEDLAAAGYILDASDAAVSPTPACAVGMPNTSVCRLEGMTPEGPWDLTVRREGRAGFLIDAQGIAAEDSTLERRRHVQVKLLPPRLFTDRFALFSRTGIVLKNGDRVLDGDVWADNGVVKVELNTIVNGSVTSARGGVDMDGGTEILGNVRTGGSFCGAALDNQGACPNEFGLRHMGNEIGGDVTVSAPTSVCPTDGATRAKYDAIGTGHITGKLTAVEDPNTTYAGTVVGGRFQGCLEAPVPIDFPQFHFNALNYDPDTWGGPNSPVSYPNAMTPAQFNALDATTPYRASGTYYVPFDGSTPRDQTNALDLRNWEIAGDITLVTDYPVDMDGIGNDESVTDALVTVVSHYTPLSGTCQTIQTTEQGGDAGDCAIDAKNDFAIDDGTACRIALFLYADNGPIAIKNASNTPGRPPDLCGAVVANDIEIKNNMMVTYDERVERILGFAPETFELAEWAELPVR